ncbi:MAG: DUF2231 domain-containing protein [Desulfopila sp.]|jgi:rubredoxin|nr:DUF2231 domain-containing protein [Desulfopila sp.]
MKKWKCTVCGYVMSSEEQPQSCPACGAGADSIIEIVEQEEPAKSDTASSATEEAQAKPDTEAGKESERQWKCTVCNYIHKGDEPPDICPVCGADKSFFIEVGGEEPAKTSQAKVKEAPAQKTAAAAQSDEKRKSFGLIGTLIMKLNLHPISVHTPNGVIPVAVVFLLLGLLLQYVPLELASFFNLIFVLLTMPVVIFTGFVAWQKKYRGAKTALFKTKLVCSAVVMILVSLMVFWRFIDPQIGISGGTGSWIYVGLGCVVLAAAGIAGHLGGKLVFGK